MPPALLTLYEKSLKSWVKTSTKNPIEWLIILLSLLYTINVHDRFQLRLDLPDELLHQTSTTTTTHKSTTSLNLQMIIRIWCGLHIYKHLSILSSSLVKCSKTTKLYTCIIISSLYLLSIAVLCTIFSTAIVANFDRLVIYLLVSDLKYLSTLTLHAMTSMTSDELTDKISLGMLLMTPGRFTISICDSLAIGLGILSSSPCLRVLAVNASSAIMTNLFIFIVFMPIFLAILLRHPSHPEDLKEHFLLSPVASWYVSRRRNYLETENYSHYFKQNQVFSCKLSLKAQVLLACNLLTNKTLQKLLPTSISIGLDRLSELSSPWASTCLIAALLYHYLFKNIERGQSSLGLSKARSAAAALKKDRALAEESLAEPVNLSSSGSQQRRNSHVPNHSQSQTQASYSTSTATSSPGSVRNLPTVSKIFKDHGPNLLSDSEIVLLLQEKTIRPHQLEKVLDTPHRAVAVRRRYLGLSQTAKNLPFTNYNDYPIATKACCENMIGFMPVPVGVAGPLTVNGNTVNMPFATTEGALIASTCRGAKAINLSGGCLAIQYREGMTRAPVVRFSSLDRCLEFVRYVESNMPLLKEKFAETTRYGKLTEIKTVVQGRNAYLRFSATTGDAMGMNMVSKGTEHVLKFLKQPDPELFPDMQVISLSSNFCTDKKSSAVNWIDGRGKSIIVEATIKKEVLAGVLKVSAESLALLNKEKNLKGSALAGSIGGFNAHAANIVAASFIATGQDPAQVVDSASCMIDMEEQKNGDLYMSCTMPCLEVGTIGGGTNLSAQRAAIDIALDGWSDHWREEYNNSTLLAKSIAGFVLAGELSLCSSLCVGDLVQSHLKLNRIQIEPKGKADGNGVL